MSSYIEAINQAATASAGSSTTKNTKETDMGKEDFLTLLVAQLQNQDPLNPDDATEFTAQLAQFSSLEQLYNLNESMDKFVESNANADRFTTLNTIGKDVAYHTGDFDYTTGPIEVGYTLDGIASEVNLSLQLNGATIATFKGTELGQGNHFFTWDGLTKDGNQASSGNYDIVLQAKAANGESIGVAPLIKSEVTGVDLDGESGGILITKAGEVAFNSILGVYEVGSSSLPVEQDSEDSEDETPSLQNNLDTVADITNDINNIVE